MAYALTPTTKAPILDGNGSPILEGTSSVDIVDTAIVQLTAVSGALYLAGLAIGSTDVTITKGGQARTHTVTVGADPFDWTLGTPEPK